MELDTEGMMAANEPSREFTNVPLGRTAEDPSLIAYGNEEGYVVEILPQTGGVDIVAVVCVLLIAIWWLLLWIAEKGD